MINAAIIDSNRIITNVVVLDSLDQHPGAVECPEWCGIGMSIDMPRPQSLEKIKQEMIGAVQAHLDSTAQSRGYDGILSLASYAVSTNPPFAAEGRAGADWRDAVWGYCYQVLDNVQAGTRTIPTVEQLIAELPAMVWP